MKKDLAVVLVSPGDDPLPPARCSSVDIYVYHLGRELARHNSVRLFARGSSGRSIRKARMTIEEVPVTGSGPIYLGHVLRRSTGHRCHVIQVENRPRYVMRLRERFPHTPIVLNMHSTNFLAPRLIPRSTVVKSFTMTDAIVANSQYVQQQLVRLFPQFSAKFHTIYPGVDLSLFPSRQSEQGRMIRERMRRRYRVGAEKSIFLLVGRFLPRKGITLVLKALKRLHAKRSDYELWVVGGRPTKSTPFHRLVRNLAHGLPVRFFPFVSSQRVPTFYLGADLLLCPSQLPEAFGMVNVEAAASGLPAVGSDAWGIKESIVEGVNGWRVKNYRSSQAWSLLLDDLLSRRSEWAEYGARARQLAVDRYSWQRVAGQFADLYRSLRRNPAH